MVAASRFRLLLVVGSAALIAALVFGPGPSRPTASTHSASDAEIEDFLQHTATHSGYQLLALVSEPQIARELALTPEQTEEMGMLADELLDGVEAATRATRQMASQSDADQKRQLAELSAASAAKWRTLDARAAQKLTPPQRRRLAQITLQMRGPDIFGDDKIKQILTYSVEQQRRLAELRADFLLKARALREEHAKQKAPGEQGSQQMGSLRREAFASYLAVLGEAQRQQMAAVRGPDVAFDLSRLKLELRRR